VKEMEKKFKIWIDTFIKEKDLPMNETITIDNDGTIHIMTYQTIYEHMLIANDKEQEQIKNMIVRIDFMNGNILDYFRHLGKCLIA
tara:strand:- start:940 stop:1197 length:258 start_codon:yes stop_codon:yes gene_type:complete